MNIWDALKTDAINKNVLLFVALISLGLAGWMMASRKETLQQLQTLQVAHEGALLRVKELTDKLTEKDLEVEKVAKLSAEEAVKKIINIPELDRILGIKAPSAVPESASTSSSINSNSPELAAPTQESLSSSTSTDTSGSENSASSSIEKNEADLANSTPASNPNTDQNSLSAQSIQANPDPTSSVSPDAPSQPPETGSVGSSSPSSEAPNSP